MGHDFYCVCAKKYVTAKKIKWQFRAPTKKDLDAFDKAQQMLEKRLPEWQKKELSH